MEHITLISNRAPGDLLVLSAAIHSLHTLYPCRFGTAVECLYPEIWQNNPQISEPTRHNTRQVMVDHGAYSQYVAINYTQVYHYVLGKALDVQLTVTTDRPQIYLTDEEKEKPKYLPDQYIVVNAGVKEDGPTKHWKHYDKINYPLPVVQIGLPIHNTTRIPGVIDLIGKTTIRQLFQIVYHARLALGPTTFLQHIAGAFDVPYLCLASGREPFQFVQYRGKSIWKCCKASPCWQTIGCCDPCIGQIKVEEVEKELFSLLT